MNRKLGLILASVAAVAVIAVGMTYACGDSCKSKGTSKASLTSGSTSGCSASACGAKNASNGGSTCGTKATMTSGSSCSSKAGSCSAACKSKGANSSMTGACGDKAKNSSMASLAGDKGYYCANCYECADDKCMAVYKGQKFAVNATTPYTQVGEARYYFADSDCAVKCQESLKAMASDIEKETVSLATFEANIVEVKDGQKWATCTTSGEKFVVNEKSPVRVVDGKKYYFCCDQCAGKETASLRTANMETHAQ